LKDEPSLVRPLSPAGRDVLQGLVNDMYDQFVTMVATGRHMDIAKVKSLADGRPYTGRQALSLGLIDAIGGEREARVWLASEKGVSATLPITDVKQPGLAASALSGEMAPLLQSLFQAFWKTLISQSLNLDEPQALWQRSAH
jgi:protease IV